MSPTSFLPGLLNNVEETGAHMAKIDVHLCMQEDCFVHSYGKLARLMIDNFAVSENVHGASGGSALIRQHHRSTMTCPAGFMSPHAKDVIWSLVLARRWHQVVGPMLNSAQESQRRHDCLRVCVCMCANGISLSVLCLCLRFCSFSCPVEASGQR